MSHFDDDTLLKFALDLLEDKEAKEIIEHLSVCQLCTERFNEVSKEMDIIGSFKLPEENIFIPSSVRENGIVLWLKRAAVILIGFAAGYFTSVLFQKDQITIVEQRLIPQTPQVSLTEPAPCPKVDIR